MVLRSRTVPSHRLGSSGTRAPVRAVPGLQFVLHLSSNMPTSLDEETAAQSHLGEWVFSPVHGRKASFAGTVGAITGPPPARSPQSRGLRRTRSAGHGLPLASLQTRGRWLQPGLLRSELSQGAQTGTSVRAVGMDGESTTSIPLPPAPALPAPRPGSAAPV